MKDDSRNAPYIENLIEEYVTNYEDVAEILIKVGNHEGLHVEIYMQFMRS